MRKFLFAVLTAAVALSNLGYAAAQTGPTGPQTPAPPSAPAAPAVNGIAENDVLNYLRTLDPNVRMQKHQDGKGVVFFFTLQRGGWQYKLELNLYQNSLNLITVLGKPIANIQSVPAQVLVPLMVENFPIGPYQFSLYKRTDGSMELLFSISLPRAGLTTASLGNLIDRFCKEVQRTYPLWSAVQNASK